jgi:hypothetical protein
MIGRRESPVEPVLLLLAGLLVFFACAIIYCEHFFASDGQIFQVFSGVMTAISGALLMRVKPSKNDQSSSPDVSAKTTTTDGKTESVVTSTQT